MTELYLGSISQQEIRDFLNDSAAEDEKKQNKTKNHLLMIFHFSIVEMYIPAKPTVLLLANI